MLNIIDVLKLLDHENYRSGQDLADQLNVTRATVHNCISRIESLGIKIERIHGRGYRLYQSIDLLCEKNIIENFTVKTRNLLETLMCLQEVDSTNRYANELDLPPVGKFSAVLAEMQNAGRGRRGREWVSPYAANLYLSILWPLQKPLHAASMLSPYLAICIAQMLSKMGVKSVGVKWPNDIYCDGKKLCGILIECSGELNGQCKMIVGVGLNICMSRYQEITIDQEWTDVESQLPDMKDTRTEIAAILIDEIVQALVLFEDNKTNNLASEWQQWDVMKDKNICVQSEADIKYGVARGINEEGGLLLETTPGEIDTISMGEISIRPTQ